VRSQVGFLGTRQRKRRIGMPTPEFEWKAYAVAADAGARGLDAGPPTLTVEIPDLTEWPRPHDKAKILLETAAEVEHALLVQYLYAAFSLRTEDQDPQK
jgi:Ferritin-like